MLTLGFAFLFAYAVGSLPFGVLITRFAGATDPRGVGSGNIGATNVLRTGRKDLAALTLLADALKGMLAVLVAMRLADTPDALAAGLSAATGAFVGHLFPVFLRFRGGKGVATFLGCLGALAPLVAGVFVVVWLAAVALTRHSSVGALLASAVTSPALLVCGHPGTAALFLALTITLWIKHRANIARLMAGTETKVGRKS